MRLRRVSAKPERPLAASTLRWPCRTLKGARDPASRAQRRLACSSSSGGGGGSAGAAGEGGGGGSAGAAGGAAPAEPTLQLHELQLRMWSAKQRMESCAQAGDYAAAAAARDELRLLELRVRALELKGLAQARSTVLHSIGQVISHRRFGYRGVIVGYDATCEASDDWIQAMRVDLLPQGRQQPFYHVLVDVRDRPGGQTTYVAQENVVPALVREVQHPLTGRLFSSFEPGVGYLAGPELRAAYPADF